MLFFPLGLCFPIETGPTLPPPFVGEEPSSIVSPIMENQAVSHAQTTQNPASKNIHLEILFLFFERIVWKYSAGLTLLSASSTIFSFVDEKMLTSPIIMAWVMIFPGQQVVGILNFILTQISTHYQLCKNDSKTKQNLRVKFFHLLPLWISSLHLTMLTFISG